MVDAHTLRPLRPSDAIVWAFGWGRESATGLKELLIIGAVVMLALWVFILDRTGVAVGLTLAALAWGIVLIDQVRRRGSLGHVTPNVAYGLVGLAVVLPTVVTFAGPWPRLGSLLALGFWELFARIPATKPKAEPWWSHRKMATALVLAGVLRMVKLGGGAEGLPTLHYPKGRGKDDEAGHWETFELPQATTASKVAERHEELAAAMNVDPDCLHVERALGAPANHVTIALLKAPRSEPVPAELPDRWDIREDIPLGYDRLGRPQVIPVIDCHAAYVGATRSGKTWLARFEVAHALLDASCPVWMISGKDDPEDWQPMKELCVRYATVHDLEGVLALLQEVQAVSNYRENLPRHERPRAYVVVDEWHRIRAAAEAADRGKPKAEQLLPQLERLISSLAATLLSRNIRLVMTFHRGTDTNVKSDLRANLGFKAVGMVTRSTEIRYVFDRIPQVEPKRKGEFLLSLEDSEPTLIRVPMLDNEAFVEVCERASRLREAEPHEPVLPEYAELEPSTEDAYPEVPEVQDDPLTLAIWEVLQRESPLQASQILDRLPDDAPWKPASREQLGVMLTKGSVEGVRWRYFGKAKKYELIPHPAGAPGSPRWLMVRGELEPFQEHLMPEPMDLGLDDEGDEEVAA